MTHDADSYPSPLGVLYELGFSPPAARTSPAFATRSPPTPRDRPFPDDTHRAPRLAAPLAYTSQLRSLSQGRAGCSLEPDRYQVVPPERVEQLLGY